MDPIWRALWAAFRCSHSMAPRRPGRLQLIPLPTLRRLSPLISSRTKTSLSSLAMDQRAHPIPDTTDRGRAPRKSTSPNQTSSQQTTRTRSTWTSQIPPEIKSESPLRLWRKGRGKRRRTTLPPIQQQSTTPRGKCRWRCHYAVLAKKRSILCAPVTATTMRRKRNSDPEYSRELSIDFAKACRPDQL